MNTETMTVHKALSELKTLDDRINKAAKMHPFVFTNKHSNNVVNGLTVQAYSAEIRSAYQSVIDLMNRRSAIKKAVMMSNATTTVVIGGEEYTVSEAIEVKNHAIPLWKGILKKMEVENKTVRDEAEENNGDRLERRADAYVKTLYEGADMKNASEEIKRVRDDFIKSQTVEIVDPIGIVEEMKKLEDKINTFSVEVDSALSVSNALTTITITY